VQGLSVLLAPSHLEVQIHPVEEHLELAIQDQ